MNPIYATAHIRHDTRIIIDVDEAACLLFGQEREDLIDQPLIGGVHSDEMRLLARLRLDIIREKGELPEQHIPFYRLNGSIFWAKAETRRIDAETFETTLTYLYEY